MHKATPLEDSGKWSKTWCPGPSKNTQLFHTTLSRTALWHNLYSILFFLPLPISFSNMFCAYWKELTCGVIWSFKLMKLKLPTPTGSSPRLDAPGRLWWTAMSTFSECLCCSLRYLLKDATTCTSLMPRACTCSGLVWYGEETVQWCNAMLPQLHNFQGDSYRRRTQELSGRVFDHWL